ncbi:MAG: hypothetical protein MUE68_04355 [Bacteroidetes bacterium]|nr:hypothetical protein [Bacteroidota bacterium]
MKALRIRHRISLPDLVVVQDQGADAPPVDQEVGDPREDLGSTPKDRGVHISREAASSGRVHAAPGARMPVDHTVPARTAAVQVRTLPVVSVPSAPAGQGILAVDRAAPVAPAVDIPAPVVRAEERRADRSLSGRVCARPASTNVQKHGSIRPRSMKSSACVSNAKRPKPARSFHRQTTRHWQTEAAR